MPGSVSKDVWINLTGSGAGALKKAFFGPSVTVLQENMGAKTVTTQAGDTVPTTMIVMAGTAGAQKYIRVQQMYRVVLLGDTRAGKSSLANTIFGEDVFRADNTGCQAETKSVHGRRITLINTPDLFSPGRSEEELKPEILRCITDFPPGPHAFLIVLKGDKSAEQQQQAVIEKICQYFSEEAFKYAAVVFTQDDQVSEGMRIQDFIDKNKCVSDLVKKCKSRYHTINNYKQCDNISSQSQVAELLNTINQILKENKGRCYTSKMLPQGGTCSKSNKSISKNELIKLTGPAAASLAKAFTGPAIVVLTQGTTNGREEENEEGKATPNNKEQEGEKQKAAKRENEIKAERKEGVGGQEGFVAVLIGLVVGLGGPSLKSGAAFIAAVLAAVLVEMMILVRDVAAYLASTRGTAGTAGAAEAERGGVKEAVRWAMQKMINVKMWIKTYSELMVIFFFSLLLTGFFLKVPFFGTLLTVILFVSLYNLI